MHSRVHVYPADNVFSSLYFIVDESNHISDITLSVYVGSFFYHRYLIIIVFCRVVSCIPKL